MNTLDRRRSPSAQRSADGPARWPTATTQALHGLLALAVVHQLVTGLLLGPPRSPADRLHDIGGLVSLGLLSAFWLWSLLRRDGAAILDYLPWLSPRRVRAVLGDAGAYARHLLSLRLPPHARHLALPAAVHGIGLLAASAMAGTGAYAYFAASPALIHPPAVHRAHALHVMLADVMWAFLLLHATAALLRGLGRVAR